MFKLDDYLRQCRVQSIVERIAGTETKVPPTADELRSLVAHLRAQGLKPSIVGSAAIFQHLGSDPSQFRPTVDVDLFVSKNPTTPPPGWRRDPESPGLVSWISPTGGYVDFLVARQELPNGVVMPSHVSSADDAADLPVATTRDILLMKLNSYREKDLLDAVQFARKTGLPPKKSLRLNSVQSENYDLVKMWLDARPTGEYGS